MVRKQTIKREGGQVMGYTVKLTGGKIEYIGQYNCAECGWVDNDLTFFYEVNGSLYCSLHKDKA